MAAVKIIDKQNLSINSINQCLFEAQILKNFNHPNILKLIDIFDETVYLYIVTELETLNLYSFMNNKYDKFTENEIKLIFK